MAKDYPRKFTLIVIVAVIILIQGILYLTASIWSIFIYKCRSNPNTQLGKVIRFIYFRDNDCGEISWLPSNSTDAAVIPIMPNVTIIALRTYILVFAYAILSGLWILTSLMVLGTSCCSAAGKKTYRLCYTPWIIVVILGSILDAIATAFHAYDIYRTGSAEKTLEYLDVKNIEGVLSEIKPFSNLFSYPAIILTCVSCRLILIWLLNISGVIIASRKAKRILSFKPNLKGSHYNQDILPSPKDIPYDQKEFSSKESTIKFSASSPRNSTNARGERNTFEAFTPNSMLYDRNFHHQRHLYNSHSQHQDNDRYSGENRRKNGSQVVKNIRTDELNRYDDMSPIAYRRYRHFFETPDDNQHRLSLNTERRHRDPSASLVGQRLSLQTPPTKEKINNAGGGGTDKQRHGPENVHITDELRGQLPWSYFSARDEIVTPKHTLVHTDQEEHDEEDGIMPPVPVPDYTYHFPRKERPSIKSGDSHATSSSVTKSPNTRW